MASKPIRKSARPVELSKDQLAEYQEAFTYFDTDQDGKINPVQFSHVIRSLGCNPTERELRVMHRTIEHSYRGLITFANFVDLMCTLVLPNTKEPYQYNKFIKKAFKTFNEHCRDGDDGTFTVEDLRMVMMDYGDALSEPMMNEMLRMANVDSEFEQLRYGDLVDTIVGRPPRSRLVMAKSRAGATGPAGAAGAGAGGR